MTRAVRPWIGSLYPKDLPLKILILGDSHHGEVGTQDEMFTINTIRDYIKNTNPSYAFFTRIMATIANAPYWTVDPKRFYESVSFFNYVDGVAVQFSRERPEADQFVSSSAGCQSAVKQLAPDVIFCCGADVRNRIFLDVRASEYRTIEHQGIKANYLRDGARLYFFSKHPSSGYSKHWPAVFQRLADVEGFSGQLAELRQAWIK